MSMAGPPCLALGIGLLFTAVEVQALAMKEWLH
jgi:hypothetical protein